MICSHQFVISELLLCVCVCVFHVHSAATDQSLLFPFKRPISCVSTLDKITRTPEQVSVRSCFLLICIMYYVIVNKCIDPRLFVSVTSRLNDQNVKQN